MGTAPAANHGRGCSVKWVFPEVPQPVSCAFINPTSGMLKEIEITGNKDTRSGFGDGILEAARSNDRIVALTADLLGSMKLNAFIKEFPQRFIQCGIAEANMIGVAAGLTIGGQIPYTTTFANFSTGRVYDQIRQSVAYSGKNVKICASHAGLTLGEDGATHQILEDIGMMKMLPGMTVIVPADYNQTKAATKAIADYNGPVYLRFGRPVWPIFTKEADFVIGKAQQLSAGTDVTLFACGHLVWKAVEAGRILEEKGYSVELINIHTIKPLDEEAVVASLRKTGCAVTCEEHNIIGGLGDSIASVAARNQPVPIEYIGTRDTFGESGKPAELLTKYGLDTPDIVAAAEKVMARKKG
jgi:transketolase